MTKSDPFKGFQSSPEIIRLAVMLYVRFPLSLRNVEDLLHERGIDISHETVRFWWNRFGPMFAAEIRRKRVQQMRSYSNWRWHLDEVFVKIKGEMHYLWRAVDHEGEVLESYVTKTRDRKAALNFLKKLMKRHGRPDILVTDKLDRIDVIMDSGVQRGTHVVKALALGAKAVGLGRGYLFPLAAAGQAGVERALSLMRAGVERDMKLMGTVSVGDLSKESLRFR